MECDNPKVYKDTSIFDGLVVNVIIMLIDVDLDEGRMAVPNRINFRKSSKGGGLFSIQRFILQILDSFFVFFPLKLLKIIYPEP